MVTKINSLTPEQEAQIPGWADKWIKIGLSTEPADFDKAEAAVLKCYDIIGAPRPKHVLKVASPWAAIFEGAKLSLELQSGTKKIGKEKLKKYLHETWHNYRGGQLWASWSSYITFFRDVCGWENPGLENFKYDEELVLNSGFVWWAEDVVAISDKPLRISLNAAGRLHHETKMAIEYRDGWGIYSWHGYRIPLSHSWIITNKEKITPDLIEHEKNAERRRIMLEIFGFEKYLAERKAKVISEDMLHGRPRRLLEFELVGEKIRAVEVLNGTLEPDGSRRKFILGCVRQNGAWPNTPAEAIAWSYGINPSVYNEVARS